MLLFMFFVCARSSAHGVLHAFDVGTDLLRCGSAVLLQQLDDGRADDGAIFAACSGVEMPKPMAQGVLVFSRTTFTMAARSVLISLRVPVTPRLDTIYKKPGASAGGV